MASEGHRPPDRLTLWQRSNLRRMRKASRKREGEPLTSEDWETYYRLMPWTWGSRKEDRAKVRELSGTDEVPILVLDDGEVVSGSGTIARWAKEHPASRAKSSAA